MATEASTEASGPSVAIIGAGLTGLLTAQGLQKVRWPAAPVARSYRYSIETNSDLEWLLGDGL
jgi:hypothetical protein